MFFFV
jgi:magnesium-transporting ATPase (P-type)